MSHRTMITIVTGYIKLLSFLHSAFFEMGFFAAQITFVSWTIYKGHNVRYHFLCFKSVMLLAPQRQEFLPIDT